VLEHRLPSAKISERLYRRLTKDFVMDAIGRIVSRLPERGGNAYVRRAARNVADDERAVVKEWIRVLNLRADDWVSVFWIADREGISTSLNTFVEHYDALWHPGADDVWIFPLSEEWVLEFSHEEEATLYSRE
jgi:hypothetical protein